MTIKFTGEEPNEYNFTRIVLNWGGLEYSPFATYGNFTSLAGKVILFDVDFFFRFLII